MPSIKKNFFYSSILTTANYIFPILVFPYISRVLGVNGIGTYTFVDSIISYFIILSMMGIGSLGIREVAKRKDSRYELDSIFSTLIVWNITSTIIAIVLLIILTTFIDKLNQYKLLMSIGIVNLFFNSLLIDWLYKGLEKFKYITIRSIIVRSIYVVAIYIFVKRADDIVIYYMLTTCIVVANATLNCICSRRYVSFSLRRISLKRITRPIIILGIYALLTSMYTTFNIAFLGFTQGETQVGYYTTATKLHSIIIAMFTALTGVMLPRMSTLAHEKRMEEFKSLYNKSINVLISFSVPVIIICELFAREIVLLVAGAGYEGAVMPMRIVIPLIFIIGYEQILIIHILLPLHKENVILINSIIGATAGIILNFALVWWLKSIGSAYVWLLSEITVMICAQYYVSKSIKQHFPYSQLIKYALYFSPCILVMLIIIFTIRESLVSFIVSSLILFLYTLFIQIRVVKNPIMLRLVDDIFSKK